VVADVDALLLAAELEALLADPSLLAPPLGPLAAGFAAVVAGLLAVVVVVGDADWACGNHDPGPKTIITAAMVPTIACSHERGAADGAGR
jgi:hypothetical protein